MMARSASRVTCCRAPGSPPGAAAQPASPARAGTGRAGRRPAGSGTEARQPGHRRRTGRWRGVVHRYRPIGKRAPGRRCRGRARRGQQGVTTWRNGPRSASGTASASRVTAPSSAAVNGCRPTSPARRTCFHRGPHPGRAARGPNPPPDHRRLTGPMPWQPDRPGRLASADSRSLEVPVVGPAAAGASFREARDETVRRRRAGLRLRDLRAGSPDDPRRARWRW